ncbi:MAG: ketosteroid isomerase-like protein [Cocleimonas sp.]|jgi:ketosteroid isomerase-like protein
MKFICLYESVEQVEAAFYKAFGTGDFALMESLYADYGVSCTHPNSPTIIGRENVINNWEFVLEGISKIIIDTEVLSSFKGKGVEVRHILESFDVDYLTGKKSEVYTTSVYILQENGWRIQMQHVSMPKTKAIAPKSNLNVHKLLMPQKSTVLN